MGPAAADDAPQANGPAAEAAAPGPSPQSQPASETAEKDAQATPPPKGKRSGRRGRIIEGAFGQGPFNLPNSITWTRLGLSLVVFGLLEAGQTTAGALCFSIAAGTDWLDGWLARKYQLGTVLGRILDPLVDKVLVCGSFVYLAGIPGSGVPAAAAVLVLGREMLVTALRSMIEGQGENFSANFAGKVKMALQSVTVPLCLLSAAWPAYFGGPGLAFRTAMVILTTAVTFWSGALYVLHAHRKLRSARTE